MKKFACGFSSRQLTWLAGIAVAAGVGLHSLPAFAAAPPDDQCELSKAKASGSYGQCVANANAKAIKGSVSPVDPAALTKCGDKITGNFTKAEDKAAGACPSSSDSAAIAGGMDTCINSVVTTLGGVPGPGGDAAKCQSNKVKAAGKYTSCRFKALAKSIKDGVSPDFTTCETKLSEKFADLDAGGTCSTTGDYATVKAAIDACYTAVAGNIDGPTVEYSEDFESMSILSPTVLGDAGFLVFGNVFNLDLTYYGGYGVYPAPNNSGGFSAIATGEGGSEQGTKQLSIYSDYNNADHPTKLIEANVFRERTIDISEVGRTIKFTADAKKGNIGGSTTALMFIKTLDPLAGYATSNFIQVNTTSLPTTWTTISAEIDVTAGLVGQIIQFGFNSTATNYEPSGNFYDNLVVSWDPTL